MKIIGFTYHNGQTELVMKGDSSLLNNRKPMFIPDWTHRLCATPGIVLRVSRLGKNIAPRFADRYYDAVAPCLDFVAQDMLESARQNGRSQTTAIAFDFSFSIGDWHILNAADSAPSDTLTAQANTTDTATLPAPDSKDARYRWQRVAFGQNPEALPNQLLTISPAEAIAEAARVMTIRQGDLIYIRQACEAYPVSREDILTAHLVGAADCPDDSLYCKIK